MCGILGVTKLNPANLRLVDLLVWEMENRGKDAWGRSNGFEVEKTVGNICETYTQVPQGWDALICHTRAATTGSPKTLENAHPFKFPTSGGGEIIGIHNGIIRNHVELNQRYGRKFEVDSMHIYKHIADGIREGELEGYGNLAWWEISPQGERRLHFGRFNSYDLHILSLEDGSIAFCSNYHALQLGARMVANPHTKDWNPREFIEYVVVRDANGVDALEEVGPLAFVKKTYTSQNAQTSQTTSRTGTATQYGTCGDGQSGSFSHIHTGSQHTSHHPRRDQREEEAKQCFTCTTEIDREVKFICDDCLKLGLELYLGCLEEEKQKR